MGAGLGVRAHALLWAAPPAVLFVLSLYLIPARVRALARNQSEHIAWRMGASAAASAVGCVYVWAVAQLPPARVPACPDDTDGAHLVDMLWQALSPMRVDSALRSIVASLGLVLLLFMGPVAAILALAWAAEKANAERPTALGPRVKAYFARIGSMQLERGSRWITVRNIWVAPAMEEITFRGCVGSVLLLCGTSAKATVLWSPILFGAAHLHHMYERIRAGEPAVRALMAVALQFTYTGVFGCIACMQFLACGHIAGPVVSHMICNFLGVPRFEFMNTSSPLHQHRHLFLALYVLGLLAWLALTVRWWTDPSPAPDSLWQCNS